LGSLGRHLGRDQDNWQAMIRVEEGHLREEIGIIRDALREYSRRLYRNRMMLSGLYRNRMMLSGLDDYPPADRADIEDDIRRQVRDIQNAGPALAHLARRLGSEFAIHLRSNSTPEPWVNLVLSTYLFVKSLAQAAVKSVEDWPDKVEDPFSDPQVKRAFKSMEKYHGQLMRWSPDRNASSPQGDPSAFRVASRYMTRSAAGTEEDIQRHLPGLESAYEDMSVAIPKLEQGDLVARYDSSSLWGKIIRHGFKVAEGIISTKTIPPRHKKGMEMAYRLVANTRREPKDIVKWWDKNWKRFLLLIDGAKTWPVKELGTDDLFSLGPFTVHNVVGASGGELESLKKGILQAVTAIQRTPVPGLRKVLYGDIHVVPRITKAHHAAWYYPSDDSLYVRRSKSTGLDEVHAIIHELGHRYWARFASSDAKKRWASHHVRVQDKDIDVDLPDVGDELPVKVFPRHKEFPTVTKMDKGRYHFKIQIPGSDEYHEGTIPVFKVYQHFSKLQRAQKNFPTEYSAKNHEEHFCDALALLALGALTEEHAIPFKAIWT
ncbi:MAG: hypothetical protein LAT68_14750, partial [Cyclobacteriaceae bacterium]|nr:hypothetical protein [Cyclobacteriaceae bacterium]